MSSSLMTVASRSTGYVRPFCAFLQSISHLPSAVMSRRLCETSNSTAENLIFTGLRDFAASRMHSVSLAATFCTCGASSVSITGPPCVCDAVKIAWVIPALFTCSRTLSSTAGRGVRPRSIVTIAMVCSQSPTEPARATDRACQSTADAIAIAPHRHPARREVAHRTPPRNPLFPPQPLRTLAAASAADVAMNCLRVTEAIVHLHTESGFRAPILKFHSTSRLDTAHSLCSCP